jgi:hypothetical protein
MNHPVSTKVFFFVTRDCRYFFFLCGYILANDTGYVLLYRLSMKQLNSDIGVEMNLTVEVFLSLQHFQWAYYVIYWRLFYWNMFF